MECDVGSLGRRLWIQVWQLSFGHDLSVLCMHMVQIVLADPGQWCGPLRACKYLVQLKPRRANIAIGIGPRHQCSLGRDCSDINSVVIY